MTRRRSIPWIHKWSRPLIGAIAVLGALTTGYITIQKLTGGSAACVAEAGTKGCNDVLSSPWATIPIFGASVPLALFGLLAYVSMVTLAVVPLVWKPSDKNTLKQLENSTWWLLLVGAIAMSVFSGYLMYVLAFQIQVVCYYCIGSALFSASLLVLTILGRTWEDIGQIFFTAIIVAMITLIGTLGVYAGVNPSDVTSDVTPGESQRISFTPEVNPDPNFGWEITTTSGEAEIELARYLGTIDAKEYVAYWCPHCHEQKQLFGKEAYKILEEKNIPIECAADSPKGQPEVCQAANIKGFPSWIINGQLYGGVQNLDQLAKVSGYTGPRNFRYFR
ncbi:vitamin K epoxide reductase family protein [Nodularia harveyana UHCC-0300]|uniref:Vitamin K epoxide reductase family protein n=1 Tax=Nodularia harveyana UHCC-0300 TaxID=2974287 RepID=A0ABU5UHV4_9CYAN|nr:vitamin K epoxide reductase family protein [Nodularia harveyana]MEA5582804.1 vitamin K epoxide reductase family protein [Nodularia harveyana UHCC-0300]